MEAKNAFGQTNQEVYDEQLENEIDEMKLQKPSVLANSGRFVVIISGTLILIFIIIWQWTTNRNNKLMQKQEAEALRKEKLERLRKKQRLRQNLNVFESSSEYYQSEMSYQKCLSGEEDKYPDFRVQISPN